MEAEKVTVDGATVSMGMKTKLGQRMICGGKVVGQESKSGGRKSARQGQGSDGGHDSSRVDSVRHSPKVKPVLLVVNRPRGIVCTTLDKDRATDIVEFLKYSTRIYPVGQPDKDSEGLLLVTNQGGLADEIARVGNAHEKEYMVTVGKPVTKELLRTTGEGVAILDTVTRPCKIRVTGIREFTVVLTQELNRQICRIRKTLGYQVRTLRWVRIMNLRLGNLKTGGYRKVTPAEYQQLLELLEDSSNISTEIEECDDAGISIGKERLDGEADS